MSHTPGPWRSQGLVVTTDDAEKLLLVTGYVTQPVSEARANARLIAAAPDLLKALKKIVEHYGDPLKVARPAIAKAEGK